MTREIEMKFPVSDLEAARRAVLRAGGQYVGTVLQTDRYFDTPQQTLMKQDRGLRVRTCESCRAGTARRSRASTVPGGQCPPYAALVTYKGPRSACGRAKSRREIQTLVADPQAVEEMLTEMGLSRRLVIQKRRSTYHLGGCLVELDELPILGAFVEIEGASARVIGAVARKLGLETEPTKASYVHLAVEACRRAGKKCTEITFARCRGRCKTSGQPRDRQRSNRA
jgi:adenylate cyclase class 2